jgi:hypothetical protein
MSRNRSLDFPLALFVLFLFSECCYGQQLWSGVISSSRAINWANAGVVGGIPTRTTACSTQPTLAAGSGSAAANTSSINAAITACAGTGNVINLGAGTWYVTGGIGVSGKSKFTLRGAGADQTILKWTTWGGCQGNGGEICVWSGDGGNPNYGMNNQSAWTAGYSQGATSITIGAPSKGSISNLQAGQQMILWQADQASDPGTIWNCAGGTTQVGTTTATYCTSEGQPGMNGPPGQSQTQTVTVTSVSGTGPYTVNFSPGLYSPIWSSTYSPQVGWASAQPVTGVGIENMTLDSSGITGNSGGSEMFFGFATNSWVTGIRTVNTGSNPYRNNVWLYSSSHITVQNNYFYGSNGTSESYGVEIGFENSDDLETNNIFQHVSSPMIINGGQGNVIAYNYAVDNYYIASPNFQQVASYPGHQNGTYFNLYEGNVGGKYSQDIIHGTSWMNTGFRNYWPGRDGPSKNSSTMAVDIESFDRYTNLLYNVLGTVGWNTNYKYAASSTTDNAHCAPSGLQVVYTLGYAAGNACYQGGGGVLDDPLVGQLIYLWGNYDTANSATQYNSSEVPSSLASYAQTVPTTACTSGTSCPASFYYGSQPSFWATAYGTPPYPAIGPDVVGGTGPGGHVNAIPAQLCLNGTPYDTNYAVRATITSIAESGTTATMTLSAAAPSSFAQYQSFWISGSPVAGYNGLWQGATVSGNTITFTAPSGLGSTTGGTAIANAIHVFSANNCYSASGTVQVPVVAPPVVH